MPKFKVIEFSNTYNLSINTVKSWIKRGQLLKGADGLIDTDDEANKLFLLQNKIKNSVKNVAEKPEPKPEPIPQTKESLRASKKAESASAKLVQLTLEKQIHTLEKIKAETVLKQMQAKREAGLFMPTDLAENIIISHNRIIFSTFWAEIETLVSQFIPDRTMAIEQVKSLRKFYSALVDRAKDDAFKTINELIKEQTINKNN